MFSPKCTVWSLFYEAVIKGQWSDPRFPLCYVVKQVRISPHKSIYLYNGNGTHSPIQHPSWSLNSLAWLPRTWRAWATLQPKLTPASLPSSWPRVPAPPKVRQLQTSSGWQPTPFPAGHFLLLYTSHPSLTTALSLGQWLWPRMLLWRRPSSLTVLSL